jgi:hypothetical protein
MTPILPSPIVPLPADRNKSQSSANYDQRMFWMPSGELPPPVVASEKNTINLETK